MPTKQPERFIATVRAKTFTQRLEYAITCPMRTAINYGPYETILETLETELVRPNFSQPHLQRLGEIASTLTIPNYRDGVYSLSDSLLDTESILLVVDDGAEEILISPRTCRMTPGQERSEALATLLRPDGKGGEKFSRALLTDRPDELTGSISDGSVANVVEDLCEIDLFGWRGYVAGRPTLVMRPYRNKLAGESLGCVATHELTHIRQVLENPTQPLDDVKTLLCRLAMEIEAYEASLDFEPVGIFPPDRSYKLAAILRLIKSDLAKESGDNEPTIDMLRKKIDEVGFAGIYDNNASHKLSPEHHKHLKGYQKRVYPAVYGYGDRAA